MLAKSEQAFDGYVLVEIFPMDAEAAAGSAFHSAHLTLPAPSVMRLSRYVRVPYRRAVPMTRSGVLRRDGRRCAYCAKRADTIDHVVPRSRGGTHTWENCVAACKSCNSRKADRLLASADEFVDVLESRFGLDLPEAADLWPAICAKHEALFGEAARA